MKHEHAHEIRVKEVKKLSPILRRVEVEIPAEEIEHHEKDTERRYQRQAKVPGFRPGKAPQTIVRQQYLADIQKEVFEHLVRSALWEALKKTELNPLNHPTLDIKQGAYPTGKEIHFSIEFEIRPEIELKSYKGISLIKKEVTIEDAEVDKVLESLRERSATMEPVEIATPEKGHFANVEMAFEVLEDGGLKQPMRATMIEIEGEGVLPELNTQLKQMKIDEQKTFETDFPADYPSEGLKGKKVRFELKLLGIKKQVLPELDDAFASSMREGFTLEQLKTEIKENLTQSKKNEKQEEDRQKIVDHLIKNNPFEVPQSLVENQVSRFLSRANQNPKAKPITIEQLSPEQKKDLTKRAEETVRGSMLLSEVAQQEKIAVDEARLEARIAEIAKGMQKPDNEVRLLLEGKGMMDQLKDEILTEQTFDYLLQSADWQ